LLYDEHCQNCPYYNQAHLINTSYQTTRTLAPVGLEDNSSDTLLVFQSPGVEEWRVGKPLQITPRSAGKRIDLSWGRVRKHRQSQNPIRTDFNIINAVQCFQGKVSSGRDAKPKAMAVRCCSNRLLTILQQTNYTKVIAFGDIAQQILPRLQSRLNPINHPHPTSTKSRNVTLNALW